MTSRPRKPSAEARLAEIRTAAREVLRCSMCDLNTHVRNVLESIYRLTAPARGRKKR